MKTILATAYAINPYKGSEDGMGWNFVMQIARFNKVVAITRENNQQHIEKYMLENPSELYQRITFLYFDTPYWMRFWKKGGRGAMLYYLLWQKMVVSFIKKSNVEFDVVHNLNFHNDWTPSFLWKLDKPFVWGPIGHHPLIPEQYLKPFSFKYYAKDRLTWAVKQFFWEYSPSLRKTVRKADVILSMNSSVNHILSLQNKTEYVIPSAATQDYGWEENMQSDSFSLISVGRLVPLKGFDLTIRSFASFYNNLTDKQKKNVTLTIVGSGPEEDLLKKMAEEERVSEQVHFISWIDRADVMELFRKASLFVFPSHEGAGMVVPEALSFGVPVVALDNEGPGEFITPECGVAVPIGSYEATVNNISAAIESLYHDKDTLMSMRKAAREHFIGKFHWDRRGEQLNGIYSNL